MAQGIAHGPPMAVSADSVSGATPIRRTDGQIPGQQANPGDMGWTRSRGRRPQTHSHRVP